MFTEDTMIYPKESEWFQQLNLDGSVQALADSDFYKNDNIGLRALDEAGKVIYSSVVGDHLQFSEDYVNDTIVPFLLS